MGIHDGHRENLRRRFLTSGAESLLPHELLELLLFYAIPRRDTNALAHTLLQRYGSLSAVFSAPVEDLKTVEGIGEHAAVLLRLIAPLCREAILDDKDIVLNTTERLGEYLMVLFLARREEHAYQICLDQKGKLLSCRELIRGSSTSAAVDIRRVVENAVLCSATSVVLAHNHPSGLALPSQEDYTFTDQVQSALATIGVSLTDHIIVADRDYVSMKDSGFLAKPAAFAE